MSAPPAKQPAGNPLRTPEQPNRVKRAGPLPEASPFTSFIRDLPALTPPKTKYHHSSSSFGSLHPVPSPAPAFARLGPASHTPATDGRSHAGASFELLASTPSKLLNAEHLTSPRNGYELQSPKIPLFQPSPRRPENGLGAHPPTTSIAAAGAAVAAAGPPARAAAGRGGEGAFRSPEGVPNTADKLPQGGHCYTSPYGIILGGAGSGGSRPGPPAAPGGGPGSAHPINPILAAAAATAAGAGAAAAAAGKQGPLQRQQQGDRLLSYGQRGGLGGGGNSSSDSLPAVLEDVEMATADAEEEDDDEQDEGEGRGAGRQRGSGGTLRQRRPSTHRTLNFSTPVRPRRGARGGPGEREEEEEAPTPLVHTLAQLPMSPACQALCVQAVLPIAALRGAEGTSPGASPRAQQQAAGLCSPEVLKLADQAVAAQLDANAAARDAALKAAAGGGGVLLSASGRARRAASAGVAMASRAAAAGGPPSPPPVRKQNAVQSGRAGSGAGFLGPLTPSDSELAMFAAGSKKCNCRKSKCLKLYCDCFAAGAFCGPSCACAGCFNRDDNTDAVMAQREHIKQRNPNAFTQKIEADTTVGGQHRRGCNCKKSHCQKKYCECFQAGVPCGEHCKCDGCHNTTGSYRRRPPPGGSAGKRARQAPPAPATAPAVKQQQQRPSQLQQQQQLVQQQQAAAMGGIPFMLANPHMAAALQVASMANSAFMHAGAAAAAAASDAAAAAAAGSGGGGVPADANPAAAAAVGAAYQALLQQQQQLSQGGGTDAMGRNSGKGESTQAQHQAQHAQQPPMFMLAPELADAAAAGGGSPLLPLLQSPLMSPAGAAAESAAAALLGTSGRQQGFTFHPAASSGLQRTPPSGGSLPDAAGLAAAAGVGTPAVATPFVALADMGVSLDWGETQTCSAAVAAAAAAAAAGALGLERLLLPAQAQRASSSGGSGSPDPIQGVASPGRNTPSNKRKPQRTMTAALT